MAERWFDPEELAELSRPTMDRAIEAIEGGDLDRAVELCTDMKREWLMLHDLMAECVLGLVTFIQEQLRDDGVKAARQSGNERGWRRHHDAIQSVDAANSCTCWPRRGARTRRAGWESTRAPSRSPRMTRRSPSR